MKRELLVIKNAAIEGINSSDRLYEVDLLLREAECFCLVSAVHQKEVLVEYLQGFGKLLSGCIRVRGQELSSNDRKEMEKNKVFVISRSTPYMNTLNIGENIFLLRRNSLKKVIINERAIRSQTEYYFQKYRIALDAAAAPGTLSNADKIIIGIIRSVSQGARLIVLYDTSGAFSQKEMVRLTSLISKMKEEGIGILISDNNPEAFYGVADRLIIFKHKQIAKKIYERELFPLASEIVLHGSEVVNGSQKQKAEGAASVSIDGLKIGDKTVSVQAARGEIVLISRENAPIDSLWEQCWRMETDGPEFTVDGRRIPSKSMDSLVRNRVAMMSCEILCGGVMENLTKEDNILMPSYRKISSRLGFYRKASAYILKDNFLFTDGEALGQIDLERTGWKLVLYRWKLFNPRLLIVHNCITAADLWERDWIKKRLIEMAERGTAILLLENEAAFCSGFADRVWMVNEE